MLRQLTESHLVLLYQSPHVWSVYRFPSLLLCVQPVPRPNLRQRVYAHLISIPTLPKKLRDCLSIRLLFFNPKSFLDPRRLVSRSPLFSRGFVSFVRFFYHGGVGCCVVCIVSLPRSVRPSSHPFCHGVRRGARRWRVCMCMYCADSCIQPKALCTRLSTLEQLYLYTEHWRSARTYY